MIVHPTFAVISFSGSPFYPKPPLQKETRTEKGRKILPINPDLVTRLREKAKEREQTRRAAQHGLLPSFTALAELLSAITEPYDVLHTKYACRTSIRHIYVWDPFTYLQEKKIVAMTYAPTLL
ncbi:hypothetical protein TNCV_1288981 [Trichonephila clavipes]|nr:hypothetical protein TNCV_1288981 [Trichonephila clavipes]